MAAASMSEFGGHRAPTRVARARRDLDTPLHRQVLHGIETLALATALDDTAPLPTKAQLCELFGVSRGTIRKATETLVRRGLLHAEVGRGTFVDKREQVRAIVRARLVEVAIPDSRFGLDITHFVPDFVGSDRCTERVGELACWNDASVVFVAPDNSLAALRVAAWVGSACDGHYTYWNGDGAIRAGGLDSVYREGHHSPEGNRLVAGAIATKLRDMGL